MLYKIDKNIPIPSRTMKGGSKRKYPFHEMDIGDSFEFDRKDIGLINPAAHQASRRHGLKFIIRTNRVWRVA